MRIRMTSREKKAPRTPNGRLKVLISAPYLIPDLDEFRPVFKKYGIDLVIRRIDQCLTESELIPLVRDIDGTICADDHYTDRVLAAAPRLKVISRWGTGTDSIDRESAARRGIRVMNVPGAFTEPVADTVLSYMLAFARQIVDADRAVKRGAWTKPPGMTLGECSLGVIGVGEIGKAVIRRASAFGMGILGNDPVMPPRNFLREFKVGMVSLNNLLREADFVSLNCSLNPSSFHLIGRRELERTKPTAYLINTSRGAVVDEPVLVRALQRNRIAGAALDVFEVEPLPMKSPLRRLENCLLASHNANSSPRAWRRTHEQAIHNLLIGLGCRVSNRL